MEDENNMDGSKVLDEVLGMIYETSVIKDEAQTTSFTSDGSYSDSLNDLSQFSSLEPGKQSTDGNLEESLTESFSKEFATSDVKMDVHGMLTAVKADMQSLVNLIDEKSSMEEELHKLKGDEKCLVFEQLKAVENKSIFLENSLADVSETVSSVKKYMDDVKRREINKQQESSNLIPRESFMRYRNILLEYIGQRFMETSTEIFHFILKTFNKSLRKQKLVYAREQNNINQTDTHQINTLGFVLDEYEDAISASQNIINWLDIATFRNLSQEKVYVVPKLSVLVLNVISDLIVEDFSDSFKRLFKSIEVLTHANHEQYLKIFPSVLNIEDAIHKVMKLGDECEKLKNYGTQLPDVSHKCEKLLFSAQRKNELIKKLEEVAKVLEPEVHELASRITQIECDLGSDIRRKFSEIEDLLYPEIHSLKARLEKLEQEADISEIVYNTENINKISAVINTCVSRLKTIETLVSEMKERINIVASDQQEVKEHLARKNVSDPSKAMEMIKELADNRINKLTDAITSASHTVENHSAMLEEKLFHFGIKLNSTASGYETSKVQFVESTLEKLKLIEQRMDIIDIACQKAEEILQKPNSELNFSISDVSYQKQMRSQNKSNYLLLNIKEDPSHSILSEELKHCKENFEKDIAELHKDLDKIVEKLKQRKEFIDRGTSTADLMELSLKNIRTSHMERPKALEKTNQAERSSARATPAKKLNMGGIVKKDKYSERVSPKKILKTTVSRDPRLDDPNSKKRELDSVESQTMSADFILQRERCHQIKFSSKGLINVYVFGDLEKESNELVVTVHDAGKNHSSFHPVFLQPSINKVIDRITLVQVEFPGHEPHSPNLFGDKFPNSLEHLSEIIILIFKELNIQSAIGFGEGAGANVLLRLALQVPDKVSGLFLINANGSTSGLSETFRNKWTKWSSDQYTLTLGGLRSLYNHWFGKKGPAVDELKKNIDKMHCKTININNMKRYYDLFLSRSSILSRLHGNLACRCMFMTESNSDHYLFSKQLFSNSDILKAQLVELNCTGNILNEVFDEVGRYFIRFSHLLDNLLDVAIPISRRTVSITETIGLQIS